MSIRKKLPKRSAVRGEDVILSRPEGLVMKDPLWYRVWRTSEDRHTYLIGETDNLTKAREWESADPRNRIEAVMHEPEEEGSFET